MTAAPAMLVQAAGMGYLLADRGFDANRLRRSLRNAGASSIIPGRRNHKRTVRYDTDRYCGGHLIENAFWLCPSTTISGFPQFIPIHRG
jgi:hypothetical protein